MLQCFFRSRRYWIVSGLLIVSTIVAGIIKVAEWYTNISSYQSPDVIGCQTFPANNIWNSDISQLPVIPNSTNYIASIGADAPLLHNFRFPYTVVPGNQPKVRVSFSNADASDLGPYPIPPNAPIEGGRESRGDRHVIVINRDTCQLYEMFDSHTQYDGSWQAGSGATWDLHSNALRPAGWTSADAAGLPIFPGLVRYEEVASGNINHALRFTVSHSQSAYLWPARHFASSSTNPNLPPMGLRLRLKADFDISSFPPQSRIILTALKRYGMMVADNGSSWVISGASDNRWDDEDLGSLRRISGSDFEAVDESGLQVNANSGEVSE
jgi:hypothetical protein